MNDILREYVMALYARGVPDFKIRALTEDFTDQLKSVFKQHIASRGLTGPERAAAYAEMNDEMRDLEKEINELVEERMRTLLSDF